MKIVIFESLGVSDALMESYLQPLREKGHEVCCYVRDDNTDVQINRLKDADVLVLANMPLKKDVLKACQNLKFIDIAFTGYDHVAMDVAREQKIVVSNASGYATEAVAELVVGGVIALYRNLREADALCRDGKTKNGLNPFEVCGKTVGLVGTGAIGSRTAEIFRALGCKTIAYNGFSHKANTDVMTYMPLEDLMRQSDILTLHCPLTEQTKNLINKDNLCYMKKTAILVNTARGAVVNSNDLAKVLNEEKIAGAVIDVFETEPPLENSHPLLSAKNVLLTPHLGFYTKEAMEKRAKIVFDNLEQWLLGTPVNVVK